MKIPTPSPTDVLVIMLDKIQLCMLCLKHGRGALSKACKTQRPTKSFNTYRARTASVLKCFRKESKHLLTAQEKKSE